MRSHSLILKTLVLATCLLVAGCHQEPKGNSESSTTDAADTQKTKDPAVAAYEAQNRAQLEKALQRERHARPLVAAQAKEKEFRQQLQLNTSGAWSALVGKHMSTFLELRRRAVRSASGTEKCTICDGRGRLDTCVLCNGTGKCPTCHGTGRFGGEVCPTCLGPGKCYVCFGSGTMPCPFCDDGLVYANQPAPSPGIGDSQLPTFAQAPEPAWNQPKAKDHEVSVASPVVTPGDIDATREVESQQKPKGGPSALELLGLVAAIIAGVMLWRTVADRVGSFLCWQFNPWAAEEKAMAEQLAEDRSFEAFAASFRTGSAARSASANPNGAAQPAPSSSKEPEPDRLQKFHVRAAEDIGVLRKLFSRLGSCHEEPERRGIFDELASRARSFKEMADLPEIKPVWQVSATLQGLLNHLAAKPDKFTPSCLRTAVSALDLLMDLCGAGIRASLVTDPPVQLLAVDDDAISRVAVSNALKKVFGPPELAADGPSALERAAGKKFDMIFLDIEMPGMNGFDLCAKLRQMPECGRTPIVFVTSHCDFNSRARLPLAGAQDLIAKPFLSFEVALKALTFVLRGRLAEDSGMAEAAQRSVSQAGSESPATAATVQIQPQPIYTPSQAFAPG